MPTEPEKHSSVNGRWQVVAFGALLVIVILFEIVLLPSSVQDLPYSQFKKLVQTGQVADLKIGATTIHGTLLDKTSATSPETPTSEKAERFTTTRVEDPGLVAELEASGIAFSGQADNSWIFNLLSWLAPLFILLLFWSAYFRRMGAGIGGGLMAAGKSRARVYVEHEIKVRFDDVAGLDEAKEELQEVIEFLRTPEKFRRLGGKVPKGVLLAGAPGTGKTLLAKAVAGEAGVPFFSLSGSEFVEMFVGVGAARVRDLFEQALQKAPCIVFIDELDALGKARGIGPAGGSHEEREQTLNQLLVEMDGFDPNTGVIIMAATNRPEILDPALLRAGRFDRHVVLDRPDVKGREAILRVHAKNVKLAAEVNLSVIAARTPGFVGADLANIVNEAALLAARKGRDEVLMADFDEAVDRVIAGLEKRNRVINPREKAIIAHHEIGHALTAELLPHVDPVRKVSIIPRGIAALGYTQQLPTEDRYLMTRSELEDRLRVLLGGRVAEEIIFGDVSTGAQDDLQKATDTARSMVTEYGMSTRLGLRTFEKERRGLFLDTPWATKKDYSEEKAAEIDKEVEDILERAHKQVRELLTTQKPLLEKLASLLLEKEVLEGDELRQIIHAVVAEDSTNKRATLH
ncbi:MAG: ATP-dependent metallopeptidase FtsH/Yme1/Tma family protein [Deltaproteobacteria bacterium]|nr:ATP-dependent metallopeptidase FtsH/Yme1/Tma family protein [Deltaproteobacteria bacterium]